MKSRSSERLRAAAALAGGVSALAYTAYRKDLRAAKNRVGSGRQLIDSPRGPTEFAESGDGPAVLVVHGAGGGFDQGLELGQSFLGDDYRIIAPSRFGYLGTPLPADASAEAQAEAHLRLLDALLLDKVPVIGVSAGAPSALQLCLKHPDRCPALALIVPLVYDPGHATRTRSKFFAAVLNTIASSDFLFWSAMRVAHATLLKTILGTPVEVYRQATASERRRVDRLLYDILPISRRVAGLRNDGIVASTLTRAPLETMHVPTLVLSAADDGYATYDGGLYTAEEIHDGRFIGFSTGGHLLLGHDAEVRLQIRSFLNEHLETKGTTRTEIRTEEPQLTSVPA